MFIIEKLLIEDNKLAKVLTALSGLVVDMSIPRPVANIETKAGKPEAIVKGAGSIKDIVFAAVSRKHAGSILTLNDIRQMITSNGGNISYAGTLRKDLIKAKLIKGTKTDGEYQILAKE